MFLFDKIFSVGAYIFLHILSALQQRRSVGETINTTWGFGVHFWWGGTAEHKPSFPGSCVTWPLGGMAGKQIKIIFRAGPGFHLPAYHTLQSPRLTHTSPQQGCLPRWLRFSLPINYCDNRQQQDSCCSCSVMDASEAEPETALWAPYDAR